MARILAIDYGGRRCGLAWSDPLQISANALAPCPAEELLERIQALLQQEQIETIVLGYPLRLNGEATDATAAVNKLAEQLRYTYPALRIELLDERYTSKLAQQTLREAGVKKKQRQNKQLVNSVSANILLQEYLQRQL